MQGPCLATGLLTGLMLQVFTGGGDGGGGDFGGGDLGGGEGLGERDGGGGRAGGDFAGGEGGLGGGDRPGGGGGLASSGGGGLAVGGPWTCAMAQATSMRGRMNCFILDIPNRQKCSTLPQSNTRGSYERLPANTIGWAVMKDPSNLAVHSMPIPRNPDAKLQRICARGAAS